MGVVSGKRYSASLNLIQYVRHSHARNLPLYESSQRKWALHWTLRILIALRGAPRAKSAGCVPDRFVFLSRG
jgi:hypothetical protein